MGLTRLIVIGFAVLSLSSCSGRTDDYKLADWLGACSPMTSLDGFRQINLNNDGTADLEPTIQPPFWVKHADPTVHWQWSGPADGRTVQVVVPGSAVTYRLLLPNDGESCLLIRGDASSTDLRMAWFGKPDPDNNDDDGPDDQ
jgi:hypothetical protein